MAGSLGGSSTRERLREALASVVLDVSDVPDAPGVPDAPLTAARSAAIALVLRERGVDLEVLLIERALRDGDPWSGHMALPGGHAESSDADLGATAERETLEEVGLDLRATGERIGQLTDSEPVRGVAIAVRPFVYLLTGEPSLTLSAEVRQALWVPILPLHRGEHRTRHSFSRAGQTLVFPAWDVGGHIVWGLTYRVLDEFFRRFIGVSGSGSAELDNSRQSR